MANVKKPVSAAALKTKRRSPITRAEGEKRLIDASIELLLERPFKDVGVRDIALRADVNHGFVHTWFGSKEDLFIAALKQVLTTISGNLATMTGTQMSAVPFDPHTQLAIKLTTWLKLEGVDLKTAFTSHPVNEALADRYVTQLGMRPDIATIASRQAVSFIMAAVMFGDMFDIEGPEALSVMLRQWTHMVGLLAKHPPA
jgi:AcrR family transcriptional regulator